MSLHWISWINYYWNLRSQEMLVMARLRRPNQADARSPPVPDLEGAAEVRHLRGSRKKGAQGLGVVAPHFHDPPAVRSGSMTRQRSSADELWMGAAGSGRQPLGVCYSAATTSRARSTRQPVESCDHLAPRVLKTCACLCCVRSETTRTALLAHLKSTRLRVQLYRYRTR